MATKTYTNILSGASFTANKTSSQSEVHSTGADVHHVTGVATIAVGFYQGVLLKFCVVCDSNTRHTLARYRPRTPGINPRRVMPSYTVSWQVTREITSTYRYFWQWPNGAREYLVDTEVTYSAYDLSRKEVDTVVLLEAEGETPIRMEWVPGIRGLRSISYVERTIGTSLVCKSVDVSKKMAIFYRSEVKEPVLSREGDGWRYAYVYRHWRSGDIGAGEFPTEAAAQEALAALLRGAGAGARTERGAGSMQALMPPMVFARPACTIYAYVYLPEGRVYKERISTHVACSAASRAELYTLQPGMTYINTLPTGMPELALGGVYGLQGGENYAVSTMPPLMGTTYPQSAGKIGLIAMPIMLNPILDPGVHVLIPTSTKENIVSKLVANYPVPAEGTEGEIALAQAQEAADWPGEGYFDTDEWGGLTSAPGGIRSLAIPTKKPA